MKTVEFTWKQISTPLKFSDNMQSFYYKHDQILRTMVFIVTSTTNTS